MQLSCVFGIKDRWPEVQVQISSPFPDMDAPFYHGIADVIPCSRRRFMRSFKQLVSSATWGLINKLTGRDMAWLIADPELRSFHKADVIIDLSGDMLTEDYGVHVAISHYIPILNALLLRRPVYICAQSIGPFKWTRLLARWIFKRARAITLREKTSFQHLSSLRADTAPAVLTADLAFLLPAASSDRIKDILALEQIDHEARPLIGVSVSSILEREYESGQRDSQASFVKEVAQALDEFCAEHGTSVLLVSHVTGPVLHKDDRQISRRVAELMQGTAFALDGEYRPEELKGIISHCTMFVGARMHANIAALSSNVPVLALSYSHKAQGIMGLLDQAQWSIAGRQLTGQSLINMMRQLWFQRHVVSKVLRERVPEIQKVASENFEPLRKFLH